MSMYQKMFEKDPTKYPARLGKKWENEEVNKLLSSIRNKKSIADIATEHERTIGGINGRRKQMAADYWFNDKKSMEEIQNITGLSKGEIEEAIDRRSFTTNKESVKIVKPPKIIDDLKVFTSIPSITSLPEKSEIAELKEEIKDMKANIKEILTLISAVHDFENNKKEINELKKEMRDMKNDTKQILSLINAMYDFNTIA